MTNKGRAGLFLLASITLSAGLLAAGQHAEKSSHRDPQSTVANKENDEIVLEKVRAAIEKNHLTKIPGRCLDLEAEKTDPAGNVLVNVRELHNTQCGGDPSTSPRLFGIQINREKTKMWSDADSDDGEMKPIVSP